MTNFKKIVEERIQKAMEEGKFDNLRGKGKPLKLDDNPLEPEDLRTAYHLLKSNVFSLPWIETWADIQTEFNAARHSLHLAVGKDESAWQQALETFDAQVQALNRRIMEYNLTVPAMAFQKPMIDREKEIQSVLDNHTS